MLAIFLLKVFFCMPAARGKTTVHEQGYLMSELESLGLSTIRLNEFNDNYELRRLVNAIKEALMREYVQALDDTS